MPLYIEKEDEIRFITYYYPFVFTLQNEDITYIVDEKQYEQISRNGKIDRKIIDFKGSKFYLDMFVSSFAKVSLDRFRMLEDYTRSGFKPEIINKAKIKNIKQYIANFKKGYLSARDYFNRFPNPREVVQKIYSQPFTIPGSPEDSSHKTAELAGKNFFEPHFEHVAEFGEYNDELDGFINAYAYCLGIVSFVKNYYAK